MHERKTIGFQKVTLLIGKQQHAVRPLLHNVFLFVCGASAILIVVLYTRVRVVYEIIPVPRNHFHLFFVRWNLIAKSRKFILKRHHQSIRT